MCQCSSSRTYARRTHMRTLFENSPMYSYLSIQTHGIAAQSPPYRTITVTVTINWYFLAGHISCLYRRIFITKDLIYSCFFLFPGLGLTSHAGIYLSPQHIYYFYYYYYGCCCCLTTMEVWAAIRFLSYITTTAAILFFPCISHFFCSILPWGQRKNPI